MSEFNKNANTDSKSLNQVYKYPEAILMLFSVMVKTSLSHTFHWSVSTCWKPASTTETLVLVDIFSNEANAKSCVCEKKKNRRGRRSA